MKEKFEQLISKRLSLEINDDFALEEIWEEEVLIITKNMEETIYYILNDCSDEYFYWMSEVFEDVVHATQNPDFINAIKRRQKSMLNKDYADNVEKEIEFSLNYLE